SCAPGCSWIAQVIDLFLTKAVDSQAGGAASRSAPRASSRDGRTKEAPAISSWQTGADAERADRDPRRPDGAVLEAPAYAPCRARCEFRLEAGTSSRRHPALNSPRKAAKTLARIALRLAAIALECARAPSGIRRRPNGRLASRCV